MKRYILLALLLLFLVTIGIYLFVSNNTSDNNITPPISSAVSASGTTSTVSFSPLNCSDQTATNTISNSSGLSVTTKSRVAGAIDSLKYNGLELVNSFDHGRQIQYAVFLDYGECYNPTEGGNSTDGTGNTSSSRFIEGCSINNQIYTKTQMAFWLPPGSSNGLCIGGASSAVNTTVLSDFIISKRIDLDYNNISNVMHITSKLDVPESSNQYGFFSPIGYYSRRFKEYYYYDVTTGTVTKLNLSDTESGNLSPSFTYKKTLYNKIPIIYDSQNDIAIAAYNPDMTVAQILYFDQGANQNSTAIMNTAVSGQNLTPGSYTFESFIIVGTLQEVQQKIPQVLGVVPEPEPQPDPVPRPNPDPSACTTDSDCIDIACGGFKVCTFQCIDGSCVDTFDPGPDEVPGPDEDPIPQIKPADSCTPIDSNNDGKLSIVDLADFALAYLKSCTTNSMADNSSCGSKDTNGDEIVNIIDLASFALNYNKPSCSELK